MDSSDPYVEAFDNFMREWLGRAVRYGAALSRDPELAEEMAQAVFVDMYRTRNEPWTARQPGAYLFRALRNKLLDERGKRRPHATEHLSDYMAVEHSDAHDWSGVICTGLLELSEDHREALTLRYFESLSLVEIASVMDRSVGAVNKLLNRAKLELKSRIERSGEVNEFLSGGQK
ncbi:MAG: RNA polymerase sigma factor [Planctomycetes bacterium]|nr:RNA polymerase sigma factor [Planctomycetota bacterium]